LALAALPLAAPAADALLIVNLADPGNYKNIAFEYQVGFVDRAFNGPFVLYSVDEARKELVETAMEADARIVWVEDDFSLGSPEDLDQRPEDIRSRVGGTIPAIFDHAAGQFYNSGHLEQINWRPTGFMLGDRQVRVAVLDTGLSPKQPVLWENVVATADATVPSIFSGDVFDYPQGVDTNGNGTPDDAVGHGTFVTSIVSTVAPYAQLVIVKVADSDGVATAWTVIKGLAFAVESGCELANISLGAVDQPTALGDVVEWASLHGLTVVAGAGNDNTDRALYPARFDGVVGVSGVDELDHKADFSNWDGHLIQAAPCVLVAGAWWEGGMVGWSGTSFAAPFVTGCLADTARKRPVWTPTKVVQLCETTGVDIDPLNLPYEGELGLRLDWSMLMKKQNKRPLISGRR
jgi:hypothetical protein